MYRAIIIGPDVSVVICHPEPVFCCIRDPSLARPCRVW
jgi:hypothetical protein